MEPEMRYAIILILSAILAYISSHECRMTDLVLLNIA